VLILLFAVSCATVPVLEDKVPEDTALFLQFPDPDGVLSNLDGFLASLQIPAGDGGMKARLEELLRSPQAPFSADQIDFSRSLGFAAILSDGSMENPEFVLFLPLIPGGDYSELQKKVDSREDFFSVLSDDDYLVIFSSEERSLDFPPSRSLDIRRFRDYPADSVHSFMDLGQLIGAMGIDRESFSQAMAQTDTAAQPMVEKIMDMYFRFFDSLESHWGYTRVDAAGVESAGVLLFSPESGFHSRGLTPVTGTRAFARFLDARDDSMISFLYNLDEKDRTLFMEKYLDFLFGEEGKSGENYQEYKTLYEDLNRAMGSRGAMYMDMDFNMKNADISSLGVDIRATGVLEMRDPQAYMENMDLLYSLPFMGDLMESLAPGLGNSLKLIQESKTTDRGLAYREIRYSFAPSANDPALSREDMDAYEMFNHMRILMVFRDNLCYTHVTTVDSGEAFLASLEEPGLSPETVVVPSWVDAFPDDAHLIMNLRVSPFLEMFFQTMGMDASWLPPEPSGVTGYITAGRELSSAARVSSEEILWMIQAFSMLQAMGGK